METIWFLHQKGVSYRVKNKNWLRVYYTTMNDYNSTRGKTPGRGENRGEIEVRGVSS